MKRPTWEALVPHDPRPLPPWHHDPTREKAWRYAAHKRGQTPPPRDHYPPYSHHPLRVAFAPIHSSPPLPSPSIPSPGFDEKGRETFDCSKCGKVCKVKDFCVACAAVGASTAMKE